MPKFSYQAINESGQTVSGMIEADSLEMVTNNLLEQGFIPSRVRKQRKGFESNLLSTVFEKLASVKAPELILFTKQFRTMVRAGVPIISILQVLENQTENAKLKKIVESMASDIRKGDSLYEAFKKQPSVFSPFFCNMILVGESSGTLPDVLDRLIFIIEHDHKITANVKSALQYPILVVVFLTIAFFVLLNFVIPNFVQIFLSAGLELPLPTRICMNLHQVLLTYWYFFLGAFLGGLGFLAYYLGTEQGKYVLDTAFLKLPIFGPLITKAAMARFASIFSILHASGVHILESVRILAETIRNHAISREFQRIRIQLEEGRGISETFSTARYFPPMVINMMAIGEASGRLEDMLSEVARHYDEEVEYATKSLTEAIGPVLTVGLAIVIGFFALAVFLPMWI